jgi:hypothetical protein
MFELNFTPPRMGDRQSRDGSANVDVTEHEQPKGPVGDREFEACVERAFFP